MGNNRSDDDALGRQIADRLKALRTAQGWSLDDLASKSGVSRATLSRLENAEVSPTAQVLGRLCAAYGLTMTRLMGMVEDGFSPLIRTRSQPAWADPSAGFVRRSLSPPAAALAGEVLECQLRPGARIDYPLPPRSGLEHHLLMVEGELALTIEGRRHDLVADDCLRYRLFGASRFETPAKSGARYLLFIV